MITFGCPPARAQAQEQGERGNDDRAAKEEDVVAAVEVHHHVDGY